MVDRISSKITSFSNIAAKLKAAKTAAPAATSSEEKLIGLLNIKPDAIAKISQTRKANAYLQVFNAALRFFNGGKDISEISSYVDRLEKNPSKIDTKV